MATPGRGSDDGDRIDPLLVADSVPARTASRGRVGRGEPAGGPVDPRTEEGQDRPAARRPRILGRPVASNATPATPATPSVSRTAAAETPGVPLLRPVDLEVPARRSERVSNSIVEAPDTVWAAAAPRRDEPTGAIDIVARARPLTGVPVPVVVPGTPQGPVEPATVVPVIPGAIETTVDPKARRKERPKVVRLPRRARIRKVSRVVRSVDAWSVFKVSVVFYLAMYVVFLVAGVLLWNVAYSTGTIDNVSSFFESFGWENFEFKGGEIYHNTWIIGLFVVAGLTGLNVVLATLYNLITDLVGGIRLTVLEEEVLVRAAPTNPASSSRGPSTTTIRASRRDRRVARRRPVG